jgi:hypothetical protein
MQCSCVITTATTTTVTTPPRPPLPHTPFRASRSNLSTRARMFQIGILHSIRLCTQRNIVRPATPPCCISAANQGLPVDALSRGSHVWPCSSVGLENQEGCYGRAALRCVHVKHTYILTFTQSTHTLTLTHTLMPTPTHSALRCAHVQSYAIPGRAAQCCVRQCTVGMYFVNLGPSLRYLLRVGYHHHTATPPRYHPHTATNSSTVRARRRSRVCFRIRVARTPPCILTGPGLCASTQVSVLQRRATSSTRRVMLCLIHSRDSAYTLKYANIRS